MNFLKRKKEHRAAMFFNRTVVFARTTAAINRLVSFGFHFKNDRRPRVIIIYNYENQKKKKPTRKLRKEWHGNVCI